MPKRRYNGKKILSKVSGLREDDVAQIWRAVKENQARLEECSGPHEFVSEGKGPTDKARCRRCQGTVSQSEARWYLLGLRHGAARSEPGPAGR